MSHRTPPGAGRGDSAGTTLPSVPGGAGRGRGGPRLLPRSKSGNKRVSPASPPAHSRTLALGRTRNWHRRPERASQRAGEPGTHRAEPAEEPASRARDDLRPRSPAAAPRRPVSPPSSLTHGAEADSESECRRQARGSGARGGPFPPGLGRWSPAGRPGRARDGRAGRGGTRGGRRGPGQRAPDR